MFELLDPVFRGIGIFIRAFPLWGPVFFAIVFAKLWLRYIRYRTLAKKEYVLLEVRLPREVHRSPRAMELFLHAFHNPGEVGNPLAKYWKGNIVPMASLEIMSNGGEIHFYMRIEPGFRLFIESQLYAQFPDAEIVEAEDYTMQMSYDEDKYSMWSNDFALTAPDPYPIATYVDYGLDRDPKEEQKIDPMTPLLEYMGSLQKGAQVWIQIVIRHHQKTASGPWWKPWEESDKWKDGAKAEIEKIKKDGTVGADDENRGQLALTPGQRGAVEAIERAQGKPAFDVGMRGVYIAEQDVFQGTQIGAMINSFKQFGSDGYNGFKPTNMNGYTYPWQDPWGWREARNKRNNFDAYRRRSFFHPPHVHKTMVLNAEELATVYHFPGATAQTATLPRVESRKSEAPSNLPT